MLDKHYDHKAVESGKYEKWRKEGYFTAGKELDKPAFSLVIPPPNVTGKLHLGHVMDTIPDDIIIRYKKMKGFDALWVPGMDHAGIATQAKVEEKLREEGKNRYELGREGFLKEAWKWKEDYAKTIHQQWATLGLSLDYTRERFTLDEGLSEAVKHVFVTLYNEGLIYQGERIINWDPELRTALSNIEVIHQDDEGEFFYFLYDIEGTKDHLVVATTRPETMFGDTAVFVNPKDERYAKYFENGKEPHVINPANGERIPLMRDSYVDISFGTGAMKCTPAHDPNDFKLGKKYGFEFIKCLDESAHMNEKAGKYRGMDRYECRKALVEDIKNNGHLLKIEKMVHSVGHSERSHCVVEPMLSKQWFVKMKPLADKVLETQKDSKKKIEFLPKRFEKVLLRWMREVDDWCVSRQLWWGHRIPAYYNKNTGEVLVSETEPDMNLYVQDEDVLDTWFSSALWPFATLGWPNVDSPDFKRYFPTSVMNTGYDIIFFWVSRMVFQSLHFTDQIPFEKVVIHGLIRDEKGRKMSKSLGNGIDPIDVIERYGTDALRYFITTNSTPGMDMRYSEEKLQSSVGYLNKIWNATRYVEGVLTDDYKPRDIDKKKLSTLDASILSKLERTIKEVGKSMDAYQFGQASSVLYDFVYDDFCSDYLETSKVNMGEHTKDVLYKVIKSIILMIYPYAPFIGEELYQSLPGHMESIMLESYPEYEKGLINLSAERKNKALATLIRDIRNYKSTNGLAPNAKVSLTLSPKGPFDGYQEYLNRFAFASSIKESKESLKSPTFIYSGFMVEVEEDIDPMILKGRLLKEEERLVGEVERGEKMLSNPRFVEKAPKDKVALEEAKLAENKALLLTVREKLKTL